MLFRSIDDLHFLIKILFPLFTERICQSQTFYKGTKWISRLKLASKRVAFRRPQNLIYSVYFKMSLYALMLFLPPSRESFGVGAIWQKISFGKKGAKRKSFIVSEHFLGHHFGLFHKMWVCLFWDWQISSGDRWFDWLISIFFAGI